MATQITDHTAQALARLPEEHKDKENIALLLSALVDQTQASEDAWWQLFAERQVDTAIGKQLDDLGLIVGQLRNGLSDDDYRRYIRARIAANDSEGVIEDLLKVARGVLNDPTLTIRIEPGYPAALTMHVESGTITDGVADILIGFLRDTAAGGVRILLHYLLSSEDTTFTMGHVTLLIGPGSPVASGADHLILDDTSWLDPSGGTLLIAKGQADEETVTYYAKDDSTGTVSLSSTTTQLHFDFLTNVQSGNSTSLGFDDDASPGTGGKFSGSVE